MKTDVYQFAHEWAKRKISPSFNDMYEVEPKFHEDAKAAGYANYDETKIYEILDQYVENILLQ